MRCPRCGADRVDGAGYCVQCRLFRGPVAPPPQQPVTGPPQPQQPVTGPPPAPQPGTGQFPASPAQPPQQSPAGPLQPRQPAMGQFPAQPPQQPGTGQFPAQQPGTGQFPVYAAPPPPTARRNPLLIPGIIFGVVAALLVGAVIVYAATSGGDDRAASPSDANPVVVTSETGTATLPSPSDEPTPSDAPSASASAGASPSGSAPCVLGVWLEEKHDEMVTVRNTGTFLFTGNGAYHRYSDSGRVVIDYGDGMHLRGSNGATTFDYVFVGYIAYQYKVQDGVITYSSPRPDGTETFIRDGHTDYTGKLEARIPAPQRINCGPVAMSLSSNITAIQLKRTSPAP